MSGSQYFGSSGGSLTTMATSGQNGSDGGPSCGTAGVGASPSVCGQAGQGIPTVNSQVYVPSTADMASPVTCKITHL